MGLPFLPDSRTVQFAYPLQQALAGVRSGWCDANADSDCTEVNCRPAAIATAYVGC